MPGEPLGKDQEEKLIRLGEAMRYDVEREGTLTPRVGYTYFSQFVGHDLTHDPTPLDGPYLDPELTPNRRTPYLDLDHVYGTRPFFQQRDEELLDLLKRDPFHKTIAIIWRFRES